MLNFTVYEWSSYSPCKFRCGLALISRLPMLDSFLYSSFGSWATCELAWASLLTKWVKILAWLVTNLSKPSRVEVQASRASSRVSGLRSSPSPDVVCYRVHCKNNYIFHVLIGKIVEIYIDDVVVKSKGYQEHLADLSKEASFEFSNCRYFNK
jgi:hypothetical protein